MSGQTVGTGGIREVLVDGARRHIGPRRAPVALAGAALATAGCLTPWAAFAFGYPGKMTLAGFPGGARAYLLMLVLPALASLTRLPGRRAAAVAGSGGLVVVAAGNLVAIASQGGGLGAVAYGAWLGTSGGLLLLAAALSCPPDAPRRLAEPRLAEPRLTEPRLAEPRLAEPRLAEPRLAEPRLAALRLPAPAESTAVIASLALVLAGVWYGLGVDEPTRFASFVSAAAFGAASLAGAGVTAWLGNLYQRHRSVTLVAAALAAAAFPFTQGGAGQWIRVFTYIGILAAAAIGLNVVVGLAGLLDLGYIAFFGVGAYVAALVSGAGVTTSHVVVPFALAMLLGACAAALFGVIIGAPTLRLRGDYLAIVTLAFGEIFQIVVNNWDSVTRGPNGLSRIPHLALGGYDFGEGQRILGVALPHFANYYFLGLAVLAGAIVVFTRLNHCRIGRAWVAIREDETAAAAMGINTMRLKLLAFAIGAFLAGTAGTVNAHFGTQISPEQFSFLDSLTLLAAVVLGGMGTVPGALIGCTALILIPEKLRFFQERRLLLFGIALILLMRYRPEGIAANRRRQRELHGAGGS